MCISLGGVWKSMRIIQGWGLKGAGGVGRFANRPYVVERRDLAVEKAASRELCVTADCTCSNSQIA